MAGSKPASVTITPLAGAGSDRCTRKLRCIPAARKLPLPVRLSDGWTTVTVLLGPLEMSVYGGSPPVLAGTQQGPRAGASPTPSPPAPLFPFATGLRAGPAPTSRGLVPSA